MKYSAARVIVMICYCVAAVLFFVRALGTGNVTLQWVVTAGMFLLVGVGFLINYTFLRCPHCGRVMKAHVSPSANCPYCNKPLGDAKK